MMTKKIWPGDPIVYEDNTGLCRWGRAVSKPRVVRRGKFLVIRIKLADDVSWVPLRDVYPARVAGVAA